VLAIAEPASPGDPVRAYQDRVGKETKWVFEVRDCRKFFESRSKRGVKFLTLPTDEVWGTYAIIELYRNIGTSGTSSWSKALDRHQAERNADDRFTIHMSERRRRP
jgi:hypothetical protein